MKTESLLRRGTALVLSVALSALVTLPVLASGSDDTVHIGSVSDLKTLAQNCALDTWSAGKTVSLDTDLDLSGSDFSLIPSFGGTFEGNGHTISGLNLTKELAPAGLFGWIDAGGTVRNLNVKGTLAPEGDRTKVGGIAGENYGIIDSCSFSGTVKGLKQVGGIVAINEEGGQISNCTAEGEAGARRAVGGIVGENYGIVNACTNRAEVNTTLQPAENKDTLSRVSDSFKSLIENGTADTEDLAMDVGGIAGYSDGQLVNCKNEGAVGYLYVGYNVGGIAGRSEGLIVNGENTALVQGRKDVGGIAGQASPDLELNLDAGTIQQLSDELDKLKDLVDSAADEADANGDKLHDNMSKLSDYLNQASASADDMHGSVQQWADDTADEAQRVADVLDESLDRMKKIKDDAQPAIDNMDGQLERLSHVLYQLAVESGIGALASGGMTLATHSLSSSVDTLDGSLGLLQSGASMMLGSVSANQTTAQKAVTVAGQMQGFAYVLPILWNLYSTYGTTGTNLGTALSQTQAGMAQQGSSITVDQLTKIYGVLFGKGGLTQAQTTNIAADLNTTAKLLSDSSQGLGVLTTLVAGLGSASTAAGVANLAGSLSSLVTAIPDLQKALSRTSFSLGALTVDAALLGVSLAQLGSITGKLAESIDMAQPAIDEAKDLLDYLADQPGITIPRLDDSVHDDADTLFSSFTGVTEQVAALTENADDTMGDLTDRVREIADQTSVITDLMIDALKKASDPEAENYFHDISDEAADETAFGQILNSANAGKVKGSLNVGGIAGAQSIESLLDPDDDLGELSLGGINGVYESRAVLRGCTNTGYITARTGAAGGIVGDAAVGLVDSCYAYGSISGEDDEGEAIGGVAGRSSGTIRASWAKCFLSGETYVGGIVGRAEENDVLGEDSVVSDCVSMVQIADATQFYGAIAGESTGTYTNNRFVSDTLAGIDYRSVAGQAEPMSYEELQALEELPAEFRTLKLTFLIDDEEVKTVEFARGASFDQTAFPQPDTAGHEGEYLYWDRTDLTDLTTDVAVNGEWRAYVTTLGSEAAREDGRTVFYVEGDFSEGDTLGCTGGAVEEAEDGAEGSVLEGLEELAEASNEQWTLTLPDDGKTAHTVRYLPAEGSASATSVYQKVNGAWQQLETKVAGSYVTFSVEGSEPELLLSTQKSLLSPWMLIPLGVVIVLLFAAGLIHRRKKPTQGPAAPTEAEADAPAELPVSAEAESTEAPADETPEQKV